MTRMPTSSLRRRSCLFHRKASIASPSCSKHTKINEDICSSNVGVGQKAGGVQLATQHCQTRLNLWAHGTLNEPRNQGSWELTPMLGCRWDPAAVH